MWSILVVDDSPIERRLVANVLKQNDSLNLVFANDGESALSHILRHDFDLVITDLTMPKVDGLLLLACIRDHSPNIPVIVMTSQGTEDAAMNAFQNGAVGYVPMR